MLREREKEEEEEEEEETCAYTHLRRCVQPLCVRCCCCVRRKFLFFFFRWFGKVVHLELPAKLERSGVD